MSVIDWDSITKTERVAAITAAKDAIGNVKSPGVPPKELYGRLQRLGFAPDMAIDLVDVIVGASDLSSKVRPALCSHCSARFSRARGLTRWCRKCDQKRRAAPGFKELSYKHASARAIANVAVSRGRIIKQPCSECGNTSAEKHHPDYSLPLYVIWLCSGCHRREHARLRAKQAVATR